MKITVGDVVTLKSSSALPMTVLKVGDGDGDVVCGWHNRNGDIVQHSFAQHSLAPHGPVNPPVLGEKPAVAKHK